MTSHRLKFLAKDIRKFVNGILPNTYLISLNIILKIKSLPTYLNFWRKVLENSSIENSAKRY